MIVMNLQPTRDFLQEEIVLENSRARLTPLKEEDFDLLKDVAFEPQIWEKGLVKMEDEGDLKKYLQTALEERRVGASYPFLIYDKKFGAVAGSTRFGAISLPHKRMEIGWTWLHPRFQGTGLNKAVKMAMLEFAFEVLKINRIEQKTDLINLQSQGAMIKLGATREGVFRRHCLTWTGRVRDSVFFSYILEEWPNIKARFFV